jgi:pimeloyl-ACP methyl ester carboxylesterase
MMLEVDGSPVFLSTGGQPLDAAKPAVLLLHGAGLDHSVWSLQSRYLAHHGRAVVAPDLPSHGRSAGKPLTTIADLAAWGWSLLDELKVEQASVAGHSMGSLVALAMAASQPKRLNSLILIAAAAEMPVHPDLLTAARDDVAAASALISMWGFGPAGQVGGNRVPGMQMRLGGQRLLERSAPGVLATDLAACNGYRDGLSDAAKVQCQAHLLLGSEDRMTPPSKGRQLATAMTSAKGRAEITVLPHCGHMIMAERPNETIDVLASVP